MTWNDRSRYFLDKMFPSKALSQEDSYLVYNVINVQHAPVL